MILLVSVNLGWLPASGYESPWVDPWRSFQTMVMPAFVLGTGLAAALMRHTRSSMLGVLQSDYVRTARAKGLGERVVILRHAFRNAVLPIVTLSALLFGELLAGAVLTEQIFTIPGLRQADRRCRLQPRLCRGAGRGAVHRRGLHPDEPGRGRALRPAEPPPEDRPMTAAVADVPSPAARPAGRGSKLRANKAALVGTVIVAVFVLLAVLAPVLPIADPAPRTGAPSASRPRPRRGWAPTRSGATSCARMIWGAQASLLAGVVSVAIAVAVGVPFGLIAGYFGGWTDSIIARAPMRCWRCPS
jgi:ABC-type dipeptide/oligopeptide/nickel transport system permease subunit